MIILIKEEDTKPNRMKFQLEDYGHMWPILLPIKKIIAQAKRAKRAYARNFPSIYNIYDFSVHVIS